MRIRQRLAARWETLGSLRLVISSSLAGVLAGLGAVAFVTCLELVSAAVLGGVLGLAVPPAGDAPRDRAAAVPAGGWTGPARRWWLVPAVTAVGGLVAGWIVYRHAPEAEGDGTDSLIRCFHHGEGWIRARVPWIKSVASIVTIGTGGSAAQEGPTASLGAGLGSGLSRVLGLTTTERRYVVLAGAAGGLGAVFRAPLGGALYAIEVLYGTTASESAALLPCLAASIFAYSTFALFITPRPVFRVPELSYHGLADLPLFALLALACAVLGWVFVRGFHGLRGFFEGLCIPRWSRPTLGGLLVGLLGVWFPEVLSSGYGWLQWGAIGEPVELAGPGGRAFAPNLGAEVLFGLALLKILATGLTIGSGGSGGLFGPSIFIGGMLGGALGQGLAGLAPGWRVEPAAFVLVGMGGFFAGVSKTPLASILMICELTGSYRLLVPLMAVVGLNLGLSRGWSLYRDQVPTPDESPAHQRPGPGSRPLDADGIVL